MIPTNFKPWFALLVLAGLATLLWALLAKGTRNTPSEGSVRSASIRPESEQSPQPYSMLREPVGDATAHLISGVVVYPGGGRATGGFVVGFDKKKVPSLAAFSAAKEGGSWGEFLVAHIDETGAFSLETPRVGSYSLAAATIGALSPVLTVSNVGDTAVVLSVEYLFGVRVAVRAPGGLPLRASPGLRWKGPTIERPMGCRSPDATWHLLALLDVDGLTPSPLNATRDNWQYLIVSDHLQSEARHVPYSIRVPGYVPVSTEVAVPPLGARLHSTVVELTPEEDVTWRDLLVQVVGLEGRTTPEPDKERPLGTLTFFDADWNSWEHVLMSRGMLEPTLIEGIPAGRYSCVFSADDAYFEVRDLLVDLTHSDADLLVDVSASASLELRVVSGNQEQRGSLSVSVTGSSGAVFHSYFERGPYFWPMLEPGDYRISRIEYGGGKSLNEDQAQISVSSGVTAQHTVALPP